MKSVVIEGVNQQVRVDEVELDDVSVVHILSGPRAINVIPLIPAFRREDDGADVMFVLQIGQYCTPGPAFGTKDSDFHEDSPVNTSRR